MLSLILLGLSSNLTAPTLSRDKILEIGSGLAQLRIDGNVAAELDLILSPEGKPLRCKILRSKGNSKMAEAICPTLMQMKMLKPAEADGGRAYGRLRYIFQAGTRRIDLGLKANPDMELFVANLPGENENQLDVPVSVYIDGEGRVADCQGSSAQSSPYADVACQQVRGQAFTRLYDKDSVPVSYVEELLIRFSIQAPDAPNAET